MASSEDRARLARIASVQGISVTELLMRLERYADYIPPAFEQAASETAGMTVAQVADLAAAAEPGSDRHAALVEIARDRHAARPVARPAGES